ncbi:Uncharacterised protein [Mycobacteroides abscessus subsp. abscessus]|nr:Uncharacterised protein [Mycobacteroides abscessus subsp. abscessus]
MRHERHRSRRQRRGHRGRALHATDDVVRLESGSATGAEQEVAVVRRAGRCPQRDPFVGQIGEVDGVAPGQRMRTQHRHAHLVIAQYRGGEVAVRHHAAAQCELDRPVEERGRQLVRKHLAEREGDVVEGVDHRLQQRVRLDALERGGMPDDVVLACGAGRALHVVGDGVGGGEKRARIAVQLPARRRQTDPTTVAVEKCCTQLFFKLADRAAEGLLAQVQLVCGAGEAAGIGDREEVLQPPQVGIRPGHAITLSTTITCG